MASGQIRVMTLSSQEEACDPPLSLLSVWSQQQWAREVCLFSLLGKALQDHQMFLLIVLSSLWSQLQKGSLCTFLYKVFNLVGRQAELESSFLQWWRNGLLLAWLGVQLCQLRVTPLCERSMRLTLVDYMHYWVSNLSVCSNPLGGWIARPPQSF